MKTFITELNHEQVDVMGDTYPDSVVYFNAKIHWGLEFIESQREIDIKPFVDRIQVFNGDEARNSDKMLIIKNNFMDILDDENKYEIKFTFLRDNPSMNDLMTIVPKFVGIDISEKIVEVLFNA